jgi:5'-phosphate synthase pdxT subunit
LKSAPVEILGTLVGRGRAVGEEGGVRLEDGDGAGDIVAVRQGNVFGTSFHPELTGDERIHVWWLREVVKACEARGLR